MGERDGQGLFDGFKDKVQQVQNSDWLKKAQSEVDRQGRNLGQQIQELGRNKDLRDAAQSIGQSVTGGVDVQGTVNKAQRGDWQGALGDAAKAYTKGGIGNIAGAALFPQGAILGAGADALGGFVQKRQARSLLADPAELSEKLVANFDALNTNKDDGFLNGQDMSQGGGIAGLLDGNRAIVPILSQGYSKFAALDGKDADKGISRDDLELFRTVQSQKAIDEKVSESMWSGAKWGTAAGVVVGLAVGGLNPFKVGSTALRYAAPVVTLGLVGGAGYGMMERHSSESYYAGKKDEAQKLVEWLRKEM
jgi:hypothetical protein